MADRYRVLVTVSRTWTRVHLMRRILTEIHRGHPDAILISGNAPKGDAMAEQIWAVLCGYRAADEAAAAGRIERHPAAWERYGKRAGPIRNAEMARAGANECVAFIRGASRGASGCVTLAEEAGIPMKLYEMGG